MDSANLSGKAGVPIGKYTLVWAFGIAIVSIIIQLAQYYSGHMFTTWISWISLLFFGAVIFVAVKRFRDINLGGYISFQKAFNTGFLIFFLSGIITAPYVFAFNKYIAPEVQQQSLSKARENMENQGKLTEDKIDEAMKFTKPLAQPVVLMFASILSGAFVGAIIALIVAAISKKENLNPLAVE